MSVVAEPFGGSWACFVELVGWLEGTEAAGLSHAELEDELDRRCRELLRQMFHGQLETSRTVPTIRLDTTGLGEDVSYGRLLNAFAGPEPAFQDVDVDIPVGALCVVVVDQGAIRGSRRSNPATYTGLLDPIHKAFAKANGVKPALFSSNSTGACPTCNGGRWVDRASRADSRLAARRAAVSVPMVHDIDDVAVGCSDEEPAHTPRL